MQRKTQDDLVDKDALFLVCLAAPRTLGYAREVFQSII